MQIGAVGFSPYIYNTNALSGSSLSKISGIGDDLLTSKTDYSALTDEDLNVNPLRRGETANFIDILDMQMQMGKMSASRLMKPAEETQALDEVQAENTANTVSAEEMLNMQTDRNLFQMQRAAQAYQVNMIA